MSDDDWFERALREDEDDETDAKSDDAKAESGDSESEPAASDAEADSELEADATTDLKSESESEATTESPSETDDSDTAGDSTDRGFSDEDSAPDFDTDDDFDPEPDDGDDELFEDDFATAFQNAPSGGTPSGGSSADSDAGFGMGEAGGDDDFGMGGGDDFGMGGGDDFGMGGGDDFGMGGGDDFGMGGGDDFGMGGGQPFEETEFDEEEFESAIPRIDIGIEGLDSMIQGGVPERSLITTVGSAGTGKTTFGLQFLHEALEAGESAVFITLEESRDRIVNTATEKGWAFDEYEADGRLAVIDLDPIEMANSLTSIRNDLPRLVEEFGASRLVLDSVSLLEMMYDDRATRRNEVYDFTKSLKRAGVTTMLTSEASEDSAYASRHGIIEYLVDAVFILRYIRAGDDFRETRLAVEIQKIRDANHSREIKPYAITNEGISVYRQANIF
ncbi:KaiC domain-containing protein [Halorussus amylolyticus]|uniref:KaiC domain-containing protein n=1 Tax=Halorussus amylolyticus TaxID=1126242 RepID=UPI001EE42B2F|nr:KaiC domain-containing protein [Halorussus amylolyticus]